MATRGEGYVPRHGKLAEPYVDPELVARAATRGADLAEVAGRLTTGSISDGLEVTAGILRSCAAHQEADAHVRQVEAAILQNASEQHRAEAAVRRAAELAAPDEQPVDPTPVTHPAPRTDHLPDLEHEPEAEPDL